MEGEGRGGGGLGSLRWGGEGGATLPFNTSARGWDVGGASDTRAGAHTSTHPPGSMWRKSPLPRGPWNWAKSGPSFDPVCEESEACRQATAHAPECLGPEVQTRGTRHPPPATRHPPLATRYPPYNRQPLPRASPGRAALPTVLASYPRVCLLGALRVQVLGGRHRRPAAAGDRGPGAAAGGAGGGRAGAGLAVG